MPVLPLFNAGIAVFDAGIAVFNAGIAVFRTPMKTIIHVNQHIIRKNLKNKENNPVLTVKTHKSNTYAHTVEIQGPSRVVYSPNKPLSCGARVWIETQAEVTTDWKWLGKKVKEHSGTAQAEVTTDEPQTKENQCQPTTPLMQTES